MPEPYEPTPPSVAAKALETVKSLPSFEDTQTQVQVALDEITTAAARLIPSITWATPTEGSGIGCERPYEQTGGQGYFLPHRVAIGVAVSDQQWAEIEQAAKESAAKVDATDIQVMQDHPGNHDVGFYGPAGIFIKVSYGGNLVVAGFTGCRLPRDSR